MVLSIRVIVNKYLNRSWCKILLWIGKIYGIPLEDKAHQIRMSRLCDSGQKWPIQNPGRFWQTELHYNEIALKNGQNILATTHLQVDSMEPD